MGRSLEFLTLYQAREALRCRELSATELAQDMLNRIKESTLNAFISVDEESALTKAQESDMRISQNKGRPLEGLPIAVKDNICVRDMPMTAASRMLENFVPPYEATVTQKLWNEGAYALGKTNLDEFAMGSTTATSYFGPCKNPWRSVSKPDVPLVPGGSSGGSAAAVAGQLALAALGTDTAGSIRQPSSFCGLVGLKPTYGRCSRWGVAPLASSLDQVGPMTQTVQDAALLMSFMAGHDPQDSTSCDVPVPSYLEALGQSIRGLRLGIPEEYLAPTIDEETQLLWERGRRWFEEAGVKIQPVKLPHTRYALQTYTVICSSEASSNLARFDGIRYGIRAPEKDLHELYTKTRDLGFGVEVKRRILIGTYAMSQDSYEEYFQRAQKVRRLIFEDFQTAFEQVDAILTPTTPTSAFPIGQAPNDPTVMYLNDVFTVPQNMAGLPAISVPAMLNNEGLPLGIQLTGRKFEEETLLALAHVLEQQVHFPRFGWKERV